jgi:hypothetical protein
MKRITAILFAALVAAGCNDNKSTPAVAQASTAKTTAQATGTSTQAADTKDDEAKIQANLAKLSPEDRALAEKQKFCASETDNRLGEMGVPIKVVVKGEPVFVCCKSCVDDVKKDPDKTLKTVKEMREKNSKK